MYNRSLSFEVLFWKSLHIYKSYYRQTIFNQLNIMVPYIDITGHSVTILWEIFVMQHKCHVRWHNFHFKRMLITGLGHLVNRLWVSPQLYSFHIQYTFFLIFIMSYHENNVVQYLNYFNTQIEFNRSFFFIKLKN